MEAFPGSVALTSLPAMSSSMHKRSLGGLEESDPVGLERAVGPRISGRRREVIVEVESKRKSSQVGANTVDLKDLRSSPCLKRSIRHGGCIQLMSTATNSAA
jgi:hypothetical protein